MNNGNNIQFDSRKASKNDVFVAIKGTISNGHDFIDKAIDQGAIAMDINFIFRIPGNSFDKYAKSG